MRLGSLFFGFFLVMVTSSSHAQSLRIAVASNFKSTLQQLLATHLPENKISVSGASSGVLYQQISLGAPFDIFLSADKNYPQQLYQKKLCHAPINYTRGQLSFWINDNSARKGGLSTTRQFDQELSLLQDKNLVLANPKLAPYGRAAAQLLHHSTINMSQIIFANNIQQSMQYVQSQAVYSGFIASSQMRPGISKKASVLSLHEDLYTPIMQQLCLISNSKQLAAGQQFISLVMSEAVQQELQQQGYLAVGKDL